MMRLCIRVQIICISILTIHCAAQSDPIKDFTIESLDVMIQIRRHPVDSKNDICRNTILTTDQKDALASIYVAHYNDKIILCNNVGFQGLEHHLQFPNIFRILLSQIIYEYAHGHTSDMNDTIRCMLRYLLFMFERDETHWYLVHYQYQDWLFDLIYKYDMVRHFDKETTKDFCSYFEKLRSNTNFFKSEIALIVEGTKVELYPRTWWQKITYYIPFRHLAAKEIVEFEAYCMNVISHLDSGKGYSTYVPYEPKNEEIALSYSVIERHYLRKNRAIILMWALAVHEHYRHNGQLPLSLTDIDLEGLFDSCLMGSIGEKSVTSGASIEYERMGEAFCVYDGVERECEECLVGTTCYFGCVSYN